MQKLSLLTPVLFTAAALAQTAAPKPASPAPQSTPPSSAQTGAQLTPGHSTPAHPLTVAQAHEIAALTGTDKVKPRLIESVMSYTQRSFPPFVPADVREDVKTSLDKLDVDSSTTATYQKYLSTEDATQIISFYKTPAGKNLLDVTPALTSEIQQTALKQAQTTFQAVMERHKAEIETAEKNYQAQHPAPSLGAPGPTGGGSTPGASSPSSSGPSTTPKKPQ